MKSLQNISIIAIPEKNYINKTDTRELRLAVQITCDTTNINQYPMHFIILIDSSGSMGGDKLNAVKAAIGYLLDEVIGCYVTIITFSSKVILHHHTPAELTSETVVTIKEAVSNIVASGHTNIADALLQGFDQAIYSYNKNIPVEVVLFTDGRHNIGCNWDHMVRMIDQKMNVYPIPIYTFSIGDHPAARQLMSLSVNSAGGVYSHMSSTIDVIRIFGDYLGEVKRRQYSDCELRFHANAGCRVVKINGVRCHSKELMPAKKYSYWLGRMSGQYRKLFICNLVVRGYDELVDEIHTLCTISVVDKYHQLGSVEAAINRVNHETLHHSPYIQSIYDEAVHKLYIKDTIHAAIQMAETGKVGLARDTICHSIKELKKSRRDAFIDISIDNLLSLFELIASISYDNAIRNQAVAMDSSYSTQQGGCYTTEIQAAESESLVSRYASSKNIL